MSLHRAGLADNSLAIVEFALKGQRTLRVLSFVAYLDFCSVNTSARSTKRQYGVARTHDSLDGQCSMGGGLKEKDCHKWPLCTISIRVIIIREAGIAVTALSRQSAANGRVCKVYRV